MASWWAYQKVKNRGTASPNADPYFLGGLVNKFKGKPKTTKPKRYVQPASGQPATVHKPKPPQNVNPGGGGAFDTMGQGNAPPPDFPIDYSDLGGGGEDWSPSAGMLSQNADLLRRQRELGQRDIDQSKTDLAAQLQQQLSGITTRRGHLQTDAQKRMDEYRRRMPIEQQKIGSAAATRGAYFSAGRQDDQTEVERATNEAVTGTQTDLDRDLESLTMAEQQANQEHARQQREITDKQDSFNLDKEAEDAQAEVAASKDAHSRSQAAAKAKKAGLEANLGRAKTFMSGRINQLMAEGKMSRENATSMALDETRKNFTGVSLTDLYSSDALKPVTPGKPQSLQKYGVDISIQRASKVSPQDRQKIQKHPKYQAALGSARAWKQAFESQGGTPDINSLLEYNVAVQKQVNPDATEKDIRAYMKQYDRWFSVMAAEIGLKS